MGWMFDPLPTTLLIWCGMLFCLAFAILSRTFAKSSRLASLLAVSFGVVSLWGVLSSFAVPESWSMQTFVERLVELPVVATFASLCFIQARRTPGSERRLKRVLRMGAPLILGAWFLALVGEQIWPQPILDPFARMPVRNFAMLAILCVPILTYQWILAYAFFRMSRSCAATRRLKLQNLCVAVGIAGYALSTVNVVAGYAFQAFVVNPALREITLVQFAIEDRLLMVWATAFLAALVIAGGAAGSRAIKFGNLMSQLKVRERFEAEWWQIEAAGGADYLTPRLHAISTAGADLGLSPVEISKASRSVKLAVLLGADLEPGELSAGKAREILTTLGNGDQDLTTTSMCNDSELSEVVEAALSISTFREYKENPELASRREWYWLAFAAAGDSGITLVPEVSKEKLIGREHVFAAYEAAAASLAVRGA